MGRNCASVNTESPNPASMTMTRMMSTISPPTLLNMYVEEPNSRLNSFLTSAEKAEERLICSALYAFFAPRACKEKWMRV